MTPMSDERKKKLREKRGRFLDLLPNEIDELFDEIDRQAGEIASLREILDHRDTVVDMLTRERDEAWQQPQARERSPGGVEESEKRCGE